MSRRFLPSTVLAATLALCAACIEEPPAGEAPGPGEDVASYGEPDLPGISHPDPRLTAKLARALERRGDDYVPRTRHLRADGSPEFTNRLILESSPYLLQHAHNPVNWFAWSDDAFERAMREGKPVLLSVGYSTCHWCHVMERESFEDVEIATFLNEHFVAIKVDREERPDVDDIYMTAVQALTGGGGWPMTVVMTPDRQPFFGGTYFPARDGDRGARKGFLTILGELAALYRDEPTRVAERARAITSEIQQAVRNERPGDVPGPGGIHLAAARFSYSFDEQWGGFGGAPKFPRPAAHELLARYFRRSRDQRARVMVERSLERMAAGGIYDQIGGGFHRYSTDATWTVPHFEKMLYDNAQLASLYLEAFQLTGRRQFARIAAETLDYVRREMTSPRGAFYSATDAESTTPDGRHAEGYFFTWTPEELVAVLGESRARAFGAYYGVSERGHVDGRSVLTARRSIESVARSLDLEPGALEEALSESRALLYAARAKRPAPLRDEKVLTSWNALMISAFAHGAFVLGRADYLAVARRAAEFLLTTLRTKDGRLLRTFIDGEARLSGYLDDYAFLVQALLDLYEASFERKWLATAIALQSKLDELYLDDADGAYFLTPDDHERLLARPKPSYDGAEPSGNAIAALNLLRLHELTTEERYRRQAERVLAAFAGGLAEGSTAHPKMLAALDYYLDEPFEIVLLWPRGAAHEGSLIEKLRHLFLPSRAVVGASEGEEAASLEALVPLVAEKKAIDGRATAYVCKQGICKRPTSDPEVFAEQLSAVVALMGDVPVPPLPMSR